MRFFIPLISIVIPCSLLSLPKDPFVIEGTAEITKKNENQLLIRTSNKSIIHWNEFDVGEGELTKFHQPDHNSFCLNRVVEANPTNILGNIQSNGKIYLINSKGF